MSLNKLDDLLIEQLQDVYYAEKHLVKAIPKMAKAAATAELQAAFTEHATQTGAHVSRLEQIFESLGAPAKTKKCPAIDGLIHEAAEMIEQEGSPEVIDAGLIASAQRVEHYEMAAYGNLKAFAEALGLEDVVALLEATLHEEHGANKLLSRISSEIVVPGALLAAAESAQSARATASGPAARAPSAARAHRGRKIPAPGRAL